MPFEVDYSIFQIRRYCLDMLMHILGITSYLLVGVPNLQTKASPSLYGASPAEANSLPDRTSSFSKHAPSLPAAAGFHKRLEKAIPYTGQCQSRRG